MSAVRSVGKVAGSTIFTVFLSLAVIVGTFSIITSEANVRTALTDVFHDAITEKYSTSELESIKASLVAECGGSQSIEQSFGSLSLVIDCSQLRARPASDLALIFRDAYMSQVYFKSYSCDFVSCFRQAQGADKATVMFSQHANSFFITMMWASAALAVVGIIIIIASLRHLFSILKAVGIGMVVAGVPGFFIKGFLPDLGGATSGIATLIVSAVSFMSTTYIGIFVIGVILAIAGFVLAAKLPPVKRRL